MNTKNESFRDYIMHAAPRGEDWVISEAAMLEWISRTERTHVDYAHMLAILRGDICMFYGRKVVITP